MLLQKVRETVAEYGMLEDGDNVICAVSGGADSVCLLHTLLALRSEYKIKIYVANVNHLLRGKESDEDSEFVRALCNTAGVEFFYREYDVKKIASEKKLGEEECGRILRYEFFEELSGKLGGAKIATAHNLNDNAETILFRLARGTAAHGISGIMHKRGNIIRPLLDVTRREIEEYLCFNNFSWREDSTNKIPVYSRNKIRLEVLPKLGDIFSSAEEKIVSAAKLVSDDDSFINEYAEKAEKECFADNKLILEPFCSNHIAVKRRVASAILEKWGVKEITAEKIECFIEFTLKDNGKMFDLNTEYYAQKSYDRVIRCKRNEKFGTEQIVDINHPASAEGWIISAEYRDVPVRRQGNNIAVFDADKLSLPVSVCYRKDGDRISLKGMKGTKKLSDIFSDEKIDRNMRDCIPIVKKGEDIIFVSGLRQSSLYCTDETTVKYLVIKYERRG